MDTVYWKCYLIINVLLTFVSLDITKAEEYNIGHGKSIQITHSSGRGDGGTCALDLDLNTNCRATYYSQGSDLYSGAWIQVALKGIYNVTKVIVWAANDDSSIFSDNFDIYVRKTPITKYDYPLNAGQFNVTNVTIPFTRGMSLNFTQPAGMEGAYVTLKKNKKNQMTDLSIAEIIVISDNEDYRITTLQNPIQNNVFIFHGPPMVDYNATRAIDDDTTTCAYTAQQGSTLQNISGWWMADLGDNYNISAVRIENHNYNAGMTRFSFYLRDTPQGEGRLCYNQATAVEQANLDMKCRCNAVVSGRYLVIVKENVSRVDDLLLCEVTVYRLHTAIPVTLPILVVTMSTTPSLSSSECDSSPLPSSSLPPPSSSTASLVASNITPPNNNNVGIIVGCIVGIGGAILIAILIAFVYFRARNQTKQRAEILDESDDLEVPYNTNFAYSESSDI